MQRAEEDRRRGLVSARGTDGSESDRFRNDVAQPRSLASVDLILMGGGLEPGHRVPLPRWHGQRPGGEGPVLHGRHARNRTGNLDRAFFLLF